MRSVLTEKDRLLKLTLDGITKRYPSGLYEWLFKYKIEVHERIIELEDRIDENFNDNGSIQELKALLRGYWVEHIKAERDFELSGKPDASLEEIRSERIDTLEQRHV